MSELQVDPAGEITSPATSSAAGLLAAALADGPGWSTAYGGPEGVALRAAQLRRELDEQAQLLSSLRAVAVAELLRERSMSEVAKILGVSKSAVQKINAAAGRAEPFQGLLQSGDW